MQADMTRAEQITQLLTQHFSPTELRVDDDSHKHAGHAGHNPAGGSHIRIHIVSDSFVGASRIARHRMVYDALNTHFAEGLHALQITAKTPSEQ